MSAPCFISLVLFRWARKFLLRGQSQSMWQLYSETHTLLYIHEFLVCLFSYFWITGLIKEPYNASVVNKSNKNAFRLSKCPNSRVGATCSLSLLPPKSIVFFSLCWGSLTTCNPSVAHPARVWKWFDILVNFIGSEHPFADLIIFRDLKVSYPRFCQTFTRQTLEWRRLLSHGLYLQKEWRESSGQTHFR